MFLAHSLTRKRQRWPPLQGGRRADAEASAVAAAAGRPQAFAAWRPQAFAAGRPQAAAGRAWAARIACLLPRGEAEEARRDLGELKNGNPALGLRPALLKVHGLVPLPEGRDSDPPCTPRCEITWIE